MFSYKHATYKVEIGSIYSFMPSLLKSASFYFRVPVLIIQAAYAIAAYPIGSFFGHFLNP